MTAVTDIFGQKVCFVEETTGVVEVKNGRFHYSVTLVIGQRFEIENDRSLTVITRTDTAFAIEKRRLEHAA